MKGVKLSILNGLNMFQARVDIYNKLNNNINKE